METPLLGLPFVALAAACGLAVYRTGRTQPAARALITFGVLLLTPAVAFVLVAASMTGSLLAPVVVPLVGLLGLGLYIVAEGRVPSPF